jgi:DNA-binding LacI/PurR family transcriptional regulator
MNRLWVVVLMMGCSASTPEPVWYGHVGRTDEESLRGVRERLQGEDAALVRLRHVAPGENARAVAVRLLSLNRVKGLILGPGIADVAEVVAAVRPYEVPIVVIQESEPVDGARILGGKPGTRLTALLDYLEQNEKDRPMRVEGNAEAVRGRGLRIDPKAEAVLNTEEAKYRREGLELEAINESASVVEAINDLLRGEEGWTEPKPRILLRGMPG